MLTWLAAGERLTWQRAAACENSGMPNGTPLGQRAFGKGDTTGPEAEGHAPGEGTVADRRSVLRLPPVPESALGHGTGDSPYYLCDRNAVAVGAAQQPAFESSRPISTGRLDGSRGVAPTSAPGRLAVTTRQPPPSHSVGLDCVTLGPDRQTSSVVYPGTAAIAAHSQPATASSSDPARSADVEAEEAEFGDIGSRFERHQRSVRHRNDRGCRRLRVDRVAN